MEADKKHIILNACPEDYENISKLFFSSKTQYFGRHRKKDSIQEIFFADYITYRLLIPITAAKFIIIGYAEVSNAPNMPALTNDVWLNFINFHYYCNLPLNATNTCFLNRFVYHMDYNPKLIKQLLEEIFYRDNKVKYILVLECPDYRRYTGKDVRNYSCLEGFSKIFYPKCFSGISCPNTPKLHVIMRDSILPQIRYRKAVPGDNDDIVDLVDQDNPLIKEQMGEYYIAEEILSKTKSSIITAEINNLTAGFLWLNDNINLSFLLENFDLQCFGNLLKFNDKEGFKEKVLTINTVKRRPLENLFTTKAVNEMYICAPEAKSLEDISNLSLCSQKFETDGGLAIENPYKISRDSIVIRWEELNNKLKSVDYYVQMREQQLRFFYNIPDGEPNAPLDALSNAFVIELFGLINLYDPRRVFELLLTAFAALPNKDYCLLAVGAVMEAPAVLLEILNYFVPVTFRPNSSVKQHLFISHRSAVYGDLCLFPARHNDVDDILNLLNEDVGRSYPIPSSTTNRRISRIAHQGSLRSLVLAETDSYIELTSHQYNVKPIIDILKNIFKDPLSAYKCFTIRCGDATRSIDDNKIVGFIIIRPFILSNFLQKHFHTIKIDEFQNFFKAEIIASKLHRFFNFQVDFIFRELSRQTHYFHFYYFQAMDRYNSPNDLAINMQPLEPRRVKKLWLNYLGESSKMLHTFLTSSNDGTKHNFVNNLDLLNDHFAVFKTNLRPTAFFGCVKNIVILGYTDICKAFLRLMIFSWHNLSNDIQSTINCVPQLNITVICSPGIMEADHEHTFKCKTCSKKAEEVCWINFKNSDAFVRDVCDRMDVRRWIKFIDGKIQSIDGDKHLIKMQSECEIYYEILLLMCGTDFGVPHTIFKDSEKPSNYCHFNNRFDKILFYHKLQLLKNNQPIEIQKSIVVYGSHLRAFEFINFLLKHGIKGSEIHLVLPRSKDDVKMGLISNVSTQDKRVEEILMEMVQDLGVQISELMNLSGYKMRYNESILQEVTFKKYLSNEEITLECDFFISFYEVFLSAKLLQVFKAANIDSDHNFILVNERYQTSVSNIYAMGNFIKHREEPNHQYRFVDPQEISEKIIKILRIFDTDISTEKKFSKSCYFQAQLPMDYLLVKVTIPKRYLANHLNNEYEFPLVTYSEGEFSRVRLNEWGMVEEIVIVTKKRKDYDYLKFFCGRHELLLNNLKSRWYLKEIVSFVDFFQESWTELLMHDDFEKLRTINKSLIVKAAKDILKKDMNRDDRRNLLYGHCQELGITSEIEHAFLEFIRNHREDFFADIALPEDFIPTSSRADEF